MTTDTEQGPEWFLDKLAAFNDEDFNDEDFKPCQFCGRVVLVGVCCDQALGALAPVKAPVVRAVTPELAAMAPELLAGLEATAEILREVLFGTHDTMDRHIFEVALERAYKLIDKARKS